MKPIDVVHQLVGESGGWDQHDTMVFSFYGVQYQGEQCDCNVNFEKGTVEFYRNDESEESGSKLLGRFAIKATLEPLEE